MHSELDVLDQKLAQLVQLTQRLRAENLQLRQEIAVAVSLQRKSQDKVDEAALRLEKLLSQIPEDAA
jgi:cell division protein ZapB